jgi:hypothetical protein
MQIDILIVLLLVGVVAVAGIRFALRPRVQRFIALAGWWFPLLLWAVILRLVGMTLGNENVALSVAAGLLLPTFGAVLTFVWRDARAADRKARAAAAAGLDAGAAPSPSPLPPGEVPGAGLASAPRTPEHEAIPREARANPRAPRSHPNGPAEWT